MGVHGIFCSQSIRIPLLENRLESTCSIPSMPPKISVVLTIFSLSVITTYGCLSVVIAIDWNEERSFSHSRQHFLKESYICYAILKPSKRMFPNVISPTSNWWSIQYPFWYLKKYHYADVQSKSIIRFSINIITTYLYVTTKVSSKQNTR